MYVTVAAPQMLGQTDAESDVAPSCPWPWQTPVCPPSCYCDYYGALYRLGEVYVYRLVATLPKAIDTTSKALLFARALGESFDAVDHPYDVRGVAVKDLGAGRWQVEIVYTAVKTGVPLVQKTDAGIMDDIATSPKLRDEFPSMTLVAGRRLQLLSPSAITFWQTAPIVWSDELSGPTQAYGRGDNVWTGTAAQRQAQIMPKTPTPVGPANGLSDQTKTIAGAVVVGAILWVALSKKGKR